MSRSLNPLYPARCCWTDSGPSKPLTDRCLPPPSSLLVICVIPSVFPPRGAKCDRCHGQKNGKQSKQSTLSLSCRLSLSLSLSLSLFFSLFSFSLSLSLLLCPPLKQALEGHLVCAAVADCRPTSVRYTGMYVQRGSSKIEEFLCHPFWKEFSLWLSRHVNLALSPSRFVTRFVALTHSSAPFPPLLLSPPLPSLSLYVTSRMQPLPNVLRSQSKKACDVCIA